MFSTLVPVGMAHPWCECSWFKEHLNQLRISKDARWGARCSSCFLSRCHSFLETWRTLSRKGRRTSMLKSAFRDRPTLARSTRSCSCTTLAWSLSLSATIKRKLARSTSWTDKTSRTSSQCSRIPHAAKSTTRQRSLLERRTQRKCRLKANATCQLSERRPRTQSSSLWLWCWFSSISSSRSRWPLDFYSSSHTQLCS